MRSANEPNDPNRWRRLLSFGKNVTFAPLIFANIVFSRDIPGFLSGTNAVRAGVPLPAYSDFVFSYHVIWSVLSYLLPALAIALVLLDPHVPVRVVRRSLLCLTVLQLGTIFAAMIPLEFISAQLE